MKLEENQMKVYDDERRMILKLLLSDNKTFKMEINMVDHQCLNSTVNGDKDQLLHNMYVWTLKF